MNHSIFLIETDCEMVPYVETKEFVPDVIEKERHGEGTD